MTAHGGDGPNEEMHRAMRACVDHARDLLDAAKILHAADKPHIAYHLATLALEEMGRRELTRRLSARDDTRFKRYRYGALDEVVRAVMTQAVLT
jgi:AbiV family abortive infection protein